MGAPSWLSLSPLLLLALTTGSIAGVINVKPHLEDVARRAETCRSEISFLDYAAKIRSEYELPVCSAGDQPKDVDETNGVSFLATESLSFLTVRQVVGDDDYSCAHRPSMQERGVLPQGDAPV
ncbi:hypothetical protein VTK26DRAFT_7114 [Humicola hyalothermophila]